MIVHTVIPTKWLWKSITMDKKCKLQLFHSTLKQKDGTHWTSQASVAKQKKFSLSLRTLQVQKFSWEKSSFMMASNSGLNFKLTKLHQLRPWHQFAAYFEQLRQITLFFWRKFAAVKYQSKSDSRVSQLLELILFFRKPDIACNQVHPKLNKFSWLSG